MYTKVDVSESQLEDLIRQSPELLEPGMLYVDHQNHTTGGRLDMLLVDSGHSLVVAELKIVEDDGMLLQCLDYYDHVSARIESYARLYKQHGIDPTQPARLLLVAPSFSQALTNRCKWIDAPISLFTYICLRFPQSEQVIPVFSDQAIPSPIEAPVAYKQDDHLNYITDSVARARANSAIDQIKQLKPGRAVADPLKYAVSLKIDGKVVAYVHPRRKNFLVSTYTSEDKWTPYPVHSDDDLIAVLQLVKDLVERRSR